MRKGGGNCLKYLNRGWNRTKGRRHKDFKKGGKPGQGVGALKMGSWNILTNYVPVFNAKDHPVRKTLRFCSTYLIASLNLWLNEHPGQCFYGRYIFFLREKHKLETYLVVTTCINTYCIKLYKYIRWRHFPICFQWLRVLKYHWFQSQI